MIHPPSPYPFLASKPEHIGRVTLLGAPLDATGSFRPGAADGPAGIRWASENLETYSPDLDCDLEDLDLGDLGDLELAGLPVSDALARIEEHAGRLLDNGTIPLLLGGEHTIALGLARAVLRRYPDAMIIHYDAHADLREQYAGETFCHASWAYHAGRACGFDRLVQLGVRSGLREEFRLGRAHSAHFSPDLRIPPAVFERCTRHPIYLTLDLDVLDPAYAPGTGTPEAGGATYRELYASLQSLAPLNIVALDLNEVAPSLDPTGATAAVAAKLVREMALLCGAAPSR